jgi:hypothetical protein
MGQQVEFFAAGSDRDQLLHWMEEENLGAVPAEFTTDEIPEKASPRTFDAEQKLYLLSPDLAAAEVMYRPIRDDPSLSRADPLSSPAIELIARGEQDGKASHGRIYLGAKPSHPLYAKAKKSYDALSRRIRKWPRLKKAGVYVGPETLQRARQHELELHSPHRRIDLDNETIEE